MNPNSSKRSRSQAYTLIEMLVAMGVSGFVLSGLMASSVALQRSFAATVDFATGQNDQIRLSDYLATEMRRASTVTPDAADGVTLTIPNFYKSDGTINSPTVTSTMGWPEKKRKKKKHKHPNIITSQTATYSAGGTTTVKYYRGNAAAVGKDPTKFYRESDGVASVIANGIRDFSVTISADESYAITRIKFVPRFRMTPGDDAGMELTQTTLLRNLD